MQPLFFQSLRLLLTDYSPLSNTQPFSSFPPPLFFTPPSASQTLCQQIEQEICVLGASSAFSLSRVCLHLSPTALQTFRQWSEEEEEDDHGPVHTLLLPPLSVF